MIVVQRTGGVVSRIFVYHFQGGDDPAATLSRDGALVAGAEVTLFGGSNADPSSSGLYQQIVNLLPVGGPVAFRGVVTPSALWVDSDGNLFTSQAAVNIPESPFP
jgi:hypothetical protein